MTNREVLEAARHDRPVRRRRTRASEDAALDAFFALATVAPVRILMADYDGTLAPFRGATERVPPYPGVAEALQGLVDRGTTRLVIISGRPIRDLEARLPWLRPRPELWGSHGLERLTADGRLVAPPVPLALAELLDALEAWMAERGWSDLFERKPYGFALHERRDPNRFAEVQAAVLAHWSKTSQMRGLERIPFDGGIEFRPSRVDKGEVVRTILAEAGNEAAVAYLGDDATDEDAFEALDGRGLTVLVRPRRRPTRAEVWLRPPEDLIDFLCRWGRSEGAGKAPARAGKGR